MVFDFKEDSMVAMEILAIVEMLVNIVVVMATMEDMMASITQTS